MIRLTIIAVLAFSFAMLLCYGAMRLAERVAAAERTAILNVEP
jgi:hypothetical protein